MERELKGEIIKACSEGKRKGGRKIDVEEGLEGV